MGTELVFILDISGSMSGLEADTVGGFNQMLQKQSKLDDEVNVTTILFSDEPKMIHDRIPIDYVKQLRNEDFEVGGMTALYDAVGYGIKKISNVHQYLKGKNGKVIFVISTDGHENMSKKYTRAQIKELIQTYKKEDWEFLFLGANIDAVITAEEIGIHKDSAVEYIADSIGTEKNFMVVSEAISYMRKGNKLKKEWKKDVELDVEARKR